MRPIDSTLVTEERRGLWGVPRIYYEVDFSRQDQVCLISFVCPDMLFLNAACAVAQKESP